MFKAPSITKEFRDGGRSERMAADTGSDELQQKYLAMRFDPQTPEYSSIVDAVAKNIDDLREELRRLVAIRNAQAPDVTSQDAAS
jgi:hypothetical protein